MLPVDPSGKELLGRRVAEGRMLPFPVVKDLDVFKGDSFNLCVRGVANAMHPLVLEAVEPTLRWRVIPAVPFSAHRAGHAMRLELVLKDMAGVLAAAIRMMHQACRRALSETGHRQTRL